MKTISKVAKCLILLLCALKIIKSTIEIKQKKEHETVTINYFPN